MDRPPPFPTDAIGSSTEPGRLVSDEDGKVFPCTACGADLVFHIDTQGMVCPFCGNEQALIVPDEDVEEQDFQAMLDRLRELKEDPESEGSTLGDKEVRCDGCGGTVVFSGTLTTSDCPYCATPIQRENVHDSEKRIPADGVLPFQITEKSAHDRLTAWMGSLWFAPSDYKDRAESDKFNGVYLPYWTFDSATFTRYEGQQGEHYYVTSGTGSDRKRTRKTRWYPAAGQFAKFFNDVVVLATGGKERELILALEPWPLGKTLPFTQEPLAGFLARTYDTELAEGFEDARKRMEFALQQEVRSRIGGDEQRIDRMDVRHSAITFKHVLLPVWILAYRYRGKTFQVMVNGATGEVVGQRPYSWVKIAFAVLAVIAVWVGIQFLMNR